MDLKRKYAYKPSYMERLGFLEVALIIVIAALAYDLLRQDTIAVVSIDGSIDLKEAFSIVETLDFLEKDASVKAVVFRINSPGGTAVAIHEIYLKLVKRSKPVISSVDALAASGAYFIASNTDHIFAKQGSEVGGIGVLVELPEAAKNKNLIASGPFKIERDDEIAFRNAELLKLDFLNAVKDGRGERLKIESAELADARIYTGFDARKLGMIDDIGGLDDAIAKAAELAKLKRFNKKFVFPTEAAKPLLVDFGDIGSNTTTAPAYYYLYIKSG